jgi:nickel/cobalt transporter (NiCoT) family protein
MTGPEWSRFIAMLLFIVALNAAGWGIYVLYVMPHHFVYKGEGGSAGLGVGIGIAITAWRAEVRSTEVRRFRAHR